MRNGYKIFVEKPEGKRPLGRPRRRWEDNRMPLREIGLKVVGWMHLPQEWRVLMNTAVNLRFPLDVTNFLTNSRIICLSRRTPLHGVNF
jgi:hypothetical protein